MPISRRYCFSSSVIAPFHYQTPFTFFFFLFPPFFNHKFNNHFSRSVAFSSFYKFLFFLMFQRVTARTRRRKRIFIGRGKEKNERRRGGMVGGHRCGLYTTFSVFIQ
uniref:Uncharacterized protein n=1 Tax=Meloidogyne enterolobii TaxID=390850 RepID=A0A6V7X4N8_MELEN|nr:unnamed protein product [Meloidogyne enterolobii]